MPNGCLASCSDDKSIKIWQLSDFTLVRTLKGHSQAVSCMAALRNGNLVSYSSDQQIKLWNTNDGSCIETVNHQDTINDFVQLKNGQLVSGSYVIKVWDEQLKLIKDIVKKYSPARCLLQLSDESLACGFQNGEVKIFNMTNYRQIKEFIGHNISITKLCQLSKEVLASSSFDTTIKLWNLNDGSLIRTLIDHTSTINSLASLSNDTFVSCSCDNTIRVWNQDEGVSTQVMQVSANFLVVLSNGNLAAISYCKIICLASK